MRLYSVCYISVGSSICLGPTGSTGSRPSWPMPEAVITVVRAPDDGVSTTETCRTSYRNIANWIESHLVWQLLNLKPNYISFKINGTNRQCLNTVKAATHFCINQVLKFLYIIKKNIKLNKQLCKVHLECALVWRYSWQLIQSFIDEKLKRQFEIRYDDLNKTSTVSNLNNSSVLRLFKWNRNQQWMHFYPRVQNFTDIKFTK